MDKKILCFHIGLTPDLNDDSIKDLYGSEITLKYLCENFSKKYRVVVFGKKIKNNNIKNNIEYLNSDDFEKFQDRNSIEICIISRYLSTFIDFELKSKKTYLWIQDIDPIIYYNGVNLSDRGKSLLNNILHKITGIVTLTNWHKKHIIKNYNISEDKISVIGNAIDTKIFNNKIKKQKHKFIWTSHGYRGVDILIDHFHDIRRELVDAELYIYRDRTAFSDEVFEEIEKYDYIHYGGKLENKELIKEFQSSDVWYYPTHFEETYCISALEAQMSKCICITTDLAALSETVGDRGILINDDAYTYEYKVKGINGVLDILSNHEKKEKLIDNAYLWAKKQDWKNRVKEWYVLFEKK